MTKKAVRRKPMTEATPDGMVPVQPKREIITRKVPKEVDFEDLPSLAEKICGWSARITLYVIDQAELRRLMGGKHFSAQNPIVPQYTIGQYNLREVGAWKEETHPRSGEVPSDKRIVEVTLTKQD
jgi:hypothetical protein